MLNCFLQKSRALTFLVLGFVFFQAAHAADVRDYAIEITAQTQKNPPQIQIQWHAADDGLGYTVARKSKESSNWSPLATLPATTTSYTDTNVRVGEGYEYRVLKNPVPDYGGSGFIYAGIELPLVESRGKIVLIVDSTYAGDLQNELERFRQDLVGDGWTVLRHDVGRNQKPPEVKALIKADYQADSQNVKSVLLFGHVPVPYSGSLNPD